MQAEGVPSSGTKRMWVHRHIQPKSLALLAMRPRGGDRSRDRAARDVGLVPRVENNRFSTLFARIGTVSRDFPGIAAGYCCLSLIGYTFAPLSGGADYT